MLGIQVTLGGDTVAGRSSEGAAWLSHMAGFQGGSRSIHKIRSKKKKKRREKKTVPVLSVPLLVDRGGLTRQVGGANEKYSCCDLGLLHQDLT